MTKKSSVIFWIVIPTAIIGGLVYWQISQLGKGIREMPVKDAEEVLVSAYSAQVLAPGTDGYASQSGSSEPLLDQYRKNPALIHQRYLLVITWVHASQIFKAIDKTHVLEKPMMINSASVESVSRETRVDGWGNPYCIFIDTKQIAFLSSGGASTLDCESLRQFAQRAAISTIDSRLTKEGSIFVTVQKRVGNASPVRHQ
jgi:hypothetical protein